MGISSVVSTALTSIRSESPVFAGAPQLLNVFLWAAISHIRQEGGKKDSNDGNLQSLVDQFKLLTDVKMSRSE